MRPYISSDNDTDSLPGKPSCPPQAEVVLGSDCLECEPSKIRAASLLRPCTSDTCMDVHSDSRVGFEV